MPNVDYRREIREAMQAGQEALNYLNQAKDCLNSAGNWGIVDMLGGGMLTTLIKRSKMKDADALVQQARSAMKRFQKELMDVDNIPEFRIETGDFLTFADYFSDADFGQPCVFRYRFNNEKAAFRTSLQSTGYHYTSFRQARRYAQAAPSYP